MRAISLWQPWAALCALGVKQFETRHWCTEYRGALLIHAAKKRDAATLAAIQNLLWALTPSGIHEPADLAFGAVIGRVELIACIPMCDLPVPCERERALGHWSPERYAWRFEKPELFASSIPHRGAQQFFNVPEEALAGRAA